MSITFTKLFSSITESTIWVEPYPTRIVWVSMLAMCDRRGRIWASVPGLAKRAGVTLEECETALERFQQPDRYSRTPENEGRRIEPIDGGWQLLNYEKYRAIRDDEARREYQREWDRTNRKKSETDKPVGIRPAPTQAEAEADTEKTSQLEALSSVSSIPAPEPPPRAAEFPRADDPRVLSLHGIACAARCRLSILDAQQWVSEGLTDAQLLDATARAKAKKPGEVIPLKFLQCFVNDVKAGVGSAAGYDAEAVRNATIAAINAKEAHASH